MQSTLRVPSPSTARHTQCRTINVVALISLSQRRSWKHRMQIDGHVQLLRRFKHTRKHLTIIKDALAPHAPTSSSSSSSSSSIAIAVNTLHMVINHGADQPQLTHTPPQLIR